MVLEPLPKKLPPFSDITGHTILLQPGASPLDRAPYRCRALVVASSQSLLLPIGLTHAQDISHDISHLLYPDGLSFRRCHLTMT